MKRMISVYIILDLLCAGIGMGVPFFNILLGFFVGWYSVSKIISKKAGENPLAKLLKISVFTSLFTFMLMIIIWSLALVGLINSSIDIANYGVPMILYDPLASLIGWIVLMVLISPFLQLLTTVFAGNIALIFRNRKK
jgi:hypothetical protein